MFDFIIKIRNVIFRFKYIYILKPVFFLLDPERVHNFMVRVGKILGIFSVTKFLTKLWFGYSNIVLSQRVNGIVFKNPVGLSGGFDKNAELTNILPSVGFGFMEIGSITGERCAGNPKPRLWRLKKSKGLLVYYGLKNIGAEAVAKKLSGKNFTIPLGTNVAMTNCSANTDLSKAILDYAKAFKLMTKIGDYFTVNVSCPNAIGGQPFNGAVNMDKLFDVLDTIPTTKPVFIKISPDTSKQELDLIIEVVQKHKIGGFIIGNLTKNRNNPKILDKNISEVGGISGKPVEELANDLIAHTYKKVGGKMTIIGCGGIFTAKDAYKKIRLGASLVQLITGMIFGGPQTISEINLGLAELLKRDGFKNISEAVGVDVVA